MIILYLSYLSAGGDLVYRVGEDNRKQSVGDRLGREWRMITSVLFEWITIGMDKQST